VWCDGTLSGLRVTRSLGTTNWDRGLRRMQNLEAGGGFDVDHVAVAPALNHATDIFLKDAFSRHLRGSTLASYRRTFAHLLKHFGVTCPVSTIDIGNPGLFRNARKVKPRTARKEIEHLRAFCAFCQERGWLISNPTLRIMKTGVPLKVLLHPDATAALRELPSLGESRQRACEPPRSIMLTLWLLIRIYWTARRRGWTSSRNPADRSSGARSRSDAGMRNSTRGQRVSRAEPNWRRVAVRRQVDSSLNLLASLSL
jgi:hypothetical protein